MKVIQHKAILLLRAWAHNESEVTCIGHSYDKIRHFWWERELSSDLTDLNYAIF